MLRGECPRHRDMRTVCDFVSCKLLWAHDLNFNWSRDEFRKRGYLESIRSFLPDTPLIRQIYDNARERAASAAVKRAGGQSLRMIAGGFAASYGPTSADLSKLMRVRQPGP